MKTTPTKATDAEGGNVSSSGDVKAALVGLLGSSHDIKEEYVDSYDDSNSGLLRPHIANTTIKDEPDIAIKDEPDIAVKHESDIAIKDEQDIAIKDEPDIAVKQESDTAIKHEPFENKSYLFIVEDPEYSYFVRCDAQYRTLEEGDLWDLESDSEVENAVVGHRGSQQLLDAVARALGARIPVLDQKSYDTLQPKCIQARASGTGLESCHSSLANGIKKYIEDPCREVDACMDTHLLKIGQVAFFRKWKITLQDYCHPGDSERLQTLKTDLEQLGKLIDAQNKAYTFRMTDILLHYVVDLIADGKLPGMDNIHSRIVRLRLWLKNMGTELPRKVLTLFKEGIDTERAMKDMDDDGAFKYVRKVMARVCDDIFLYQIVRWGYSPLSFWILGNLDKIATGKGVCNNLEAPAWTWEQIDEKVDS